MSWKPFVPNVEEWKNHFLRASQMKYIPKQKSYVIGQFGKGESVLQPKIELVTPTQQAVERAKSDLKKREREGGPVLKFEPDEPKPKKTKKKQVITPTVSTNYAYKSYMDVFLKYGTSSQKPPLEAQLFIPDSAGFMDMSDAFGGGNMGLFQRALLTEKSSFVDLEGPLYMDICQQDRYLINGVQVGIKLWPSRESFCLISAVSSPKYRIHIEDSILRCCYLKINPGVLLGHNEAIKKQPALYPFMKSDIKCFGIPAGQFHLNVDDVFQGEIPQHLVVGFVSSKSYSGSYGTNPFNFQHFNCNFAAFYVDGKSVPSAPFEPNFTSDNFISEYLSLFAGKKYETENQELVLSRSDFSRGYCFFFVFSINPSCENDDTLPLLRKGHTRLQLKFDKALPVQSQSQTGATAD
ncbi:uncharacterized protein F54H12.2-like [Saccostrea echinata]|uniref:uncharacterized protein F54H12.2-like n=1 Tax=Saccostrea echinata TaxID=191078 RepID=UPI002A80EBD4|nr:uncharacterized protein F54H12.2-like [Saccostrea echinata]